MGSYLWRTRSGAMKMKVLVFGVMREHFGAPVVEVDLAYPALVSDLRHALAQQLPAALLGYPYAVAVNLEYAEDLTPLADGDEIALIPPVSGG